MAAISLVRSTSATSISCGSSGFRRVVLLAMLTICEAQLSHAADVQVRVSDLRGDPVPDVVVTLEGAESTATSPGRWETVMDQVRKNFEPRILIVRAGSAVEFPNSDSTAHQVYSFSPTKRFELPLYRGSTPSPVIFDKPGIVVLGCNIHDNMIGYIYVTGAPYFGKTDTAGHLQLHKVREARYRLSAWTPRLAANDVPTAVEIAVDAANLSFDIRFTHALQSPASPQDTRVRDY